MARESGGGATMKRVVCLAAVTMLGVTLAAVSNEAQQARYRIRPLELTGNLHVLTSDPAEQGRRTGGNTAVFLTSEGVVLVDTKYQGYGADILAEVRKIIDKPVTTIINTHTHYDHSGANPEFPDTVNFVAHENTAAHLASTDCDDGTGYEGGSIKNCERFQGENMFARKGLPFVDADNANGSATEFGETLRKAVDGIPDVDTIITGHADEPHVWQDLVEFAGFYNDLLMQTHQGRAAGRSAAEIVSSYAQPDGYSDFVAPPNTLERIVSLVLEGR